MTLKRSDRFKPIHNLARQSEDAAAHTLGKVQRELQEHEQKLAELRHYLQEYESRFKQQAEKGMNVAQAMSYRKFITQLEMAIEEQKKHILLATEACESSRENWNSKRQKSQVLEKVMLRYQGQEKIQNNRKEQLRSDEFVSNQFWHKKFS